MIQFNSNARSYWLVFYEKRNKWFIEMVQADVIVQNKRFFGVKKYLVML